MSHSPLFALAYNASLLLVVALVYDVFITRALPRGRTHPGQLFVGLLVGAVGVALMISPWQFEPGIAFDSRSVLLGIAGLLIGPIVAAVAMAMTAAFRLYQGGAGAWTGIAVIVASGCLGLAWRGARPPRPEGYSFGELFVFGVVVHAVMLALMFSLPDGIGASVLAVVGLPVLAIYPLATALVGSLIVNQARRDAMASRLVESEERLRLALSAANQGLWDLDLRTGNATVSAEYASMLGYDPASFRESNDAWRERLHPDDRESMAATYRDYVAGRLPEYRVEFRQRTAAGEWLWLLSRGSIVSRDASGVPLRMVGTHTDITALRHAEERLRASEAETSRLLAESDQSRSALLSVVEDLQSADRKLRSSEAFFQGLFRNMSDGLAYCRLVREDGVPRDVVYLQVNRAFERIRDVSDVVGRKATEVVPGVYESNPELLAAFGRVATSGVAEVIESHIQQLDKWLLVSIFSPEPDHFVSVFTDVTELKQSEVENRRQLAELKTWHEATLGREDRVLGLKTEVNDLRRRLGEPSRYASVEREEAS